MPDVGNTSIFSQTDASNNSATMPGWNGAALPSTIDDAGRAFQGAFTREWNWRNPTISSAGTDTVTLTYSVAPASQYNGQTFAFVAGGTNTGAATLNVNALGAASIKKDVNGTLTALAAGDIVAGRVAVCCYNTAGTAFILMNPATFSLAETVTISDDFVAPPVTLTDAATISWDMSTGMNFTVTLGGNRTLDAPTGETAGQSGLLFVVQDGTGSRTVTWDASYKFPNATDEKPDPTASSTTCYQYYSRGANDIIVKKRWQSASNSIGFYKEYDLGAVNDNSNMSQAHGLGRYPAAIEVYLENDSANLNYSVGDRVPIAACGINNSDTGLHPWMSATTAGVIISTTIYLYNKTTFAAAAITEADWSVILRVYE